MSLPLGLNCQLSGWVYVGPQGLEGWVETVLEAFWCPEEKEQFPRIAIGMFPFVLLWLPQALHCGHEAMPHVAPPFGGLVQRGHPF